MKTILVPTDFSNAARNAAEYAAHFAKDVKAKILLFHAYHVPVPVPEIPVMAISQEELQKENEVSLKKEAAYLKKIAGVEATYKANIGFAVNEIIEEGKNASLIVMGMQGASKLSEALIGSITTSVLRKIQIPVLVVPENVKYKRPEKIVFACDYDPETDTNTLNPLKALMKTFSSKVFVVNVKQKQQPANINEAIAGMDLENKLCDVKHVYYFPEKKDLVEGINGFVEDKKADMIAIIPHRYNLLERLFHKSISKKMAFHTHVPLLALPDNHKSIDAYFL